MTDVPFIVTVSFVIFYAVAEDVRVAPRSNREGEPTREYFERHAMYDFSMSARVLKDRVHIETEREIHLIKEIFIRTIVRKFFKNMKF